MWLLGQNLPFGWFCLLLPVNRVAGHEFVGCESYLVSFISMSKAKYILLQEQVLIQEKNLLSEIAFGCDQV